MENNRKSLLEAYPGETTEEFNEYYIDSGKHHKILTGHCVTQMEDKCNGFCPECRQKLNCWLFEEFEGEWREINRITFGLNPVRQ